MKPKPANPGAITRMLAAAGLPRGERHRASRGMVRGGWSTFTEGVVSEAIVTSTRRRVNRGSYRDGSPRQEWETTNTPTGYVKVIWQWASHGKATPLERVEISARKMNEAAEVLRAKGCNVEIDVWSTTGETYLLVHRTDESGEVVRY